MSNYLDLKQLSYHLPSGRLIFSDITFTFNQPIVALVGRNGMGKSLLAQLMAGKIQSTSGQCTHTDSTYYLAQTITVYSNETVADALAITPVLAALQNIERGSIDESDFEIIGSRWSLEQDVHRILSKLSLPTVDLTLPMKYLSGGEQMRIRIAAAFLSSASTLILDEPSNHLDHQYKSKLWEMIAAWDGQVILITHDRFLLRKVSHFVELSSQGLCSYSGSYDDFVSQQARKEVLALQNLARVKLQQKKCIVNAQQQLEKLNKRATQAKRNRGAQNQATILLDRQKNRSEKSLGKAKAERESILQMASEKIKKATCDVIQNSTITLHDYCLHEQSPQLLAQLEYVKLPFVIKQLEIIDLQIEKGCRMAITGNNGMGKTILLKAIAEHSLVPYTYIDQHLSSLDQNSTLLTQLSYHETEEEIEHLRMQFAQLGLTSDIINQPIYSLSGGEQLKATLALTLYKGEPTQLLLLDEPNNHLDLDSLNALEMMLCQYNGGLIVISHDVEFLKNIDIGCYLQATKSGWVRTTWP